MGEASSAAARLLAPARRIAAGLRDGLDERLHPYRRRRARARLAALAPDSVLFVCLGNVCRSPYAEWRWRERCTTIDAHSGGFIGPGRAPPETAILVALRSGIDHAGHVSRLTTAADVAQAGAVFVFDRFNLRRLRALVGSGASHVFWLGDFDREWSGKRAIIDPWGRSEGDFEHVFARIDRCVDEVVSAAGAVSDAGPETTPPTP